MSNAYLELSINGLSVRFERFFDDQLPRVDAEGEEESVIRTASGSTVIQGTSYDNFSLWNINGYCSEDDFDTLCLMRIESKYRRQNGLDPSILVIDRTQKHRERGIRTRALAPGTTEVSRSPYVLYFAQYKAIMPGLPQARLTGKGFTANLTLIETDRVAP